MLLEALGVPPLDQNRNWREVPPFTYGHAAAFISAPESQLVMHVVRLHRVLKEAAAADGTRGLVRPIVLNMIGKVLSRIADRPEAEQPTRSLLIGDLRSVIDQRNLRSIARAILPLMLTEADTKSPQKIGTLSEATKLQPQAILGCLLELELSGYVRPISRPTNLADRTWEVSYDFVARLLGQILKTPIQTFCERVAPVLYPLLFGFWAGAAIGLYIFAPWLEHIHVDEDLRSLGLHYEQVDGGIAVNAVQKTFSEITKAVTYLKKLGPIKSLRLDGTSITNLNGVNSLSGLKELFVIGCDSLDNIDGLKGLESLQVLSLYGCGLLTNVNSLRGLDGLKVLDLSLCIRLNNLDGLIELKNLEQLRIVSCDSITNQNVDSLKGIKSLKELVLANCPKLTSIDSLSELKGLKKLSVTGSRISKESVENIRAKLPATTIEWLP